MNTLRHTRYQAAVVRDGAVLLLKCAYREGGRTVWMLPGGGREEGEDELSCVAREVQEETCLTVQVLRLMSDVPAEPPDGMYVQWRTYRCAVLAGEAVPGGGEGAIAELVDITWLPLRNDLGWPQEIRADTILYPQLQAIRSAVNATNAAH